MPDTRCQRCGVVGFVRRELILHGDTLTVEYTCKRSDHVCERRVSPTIYRSRCRRFSPDRGRIDPEDSAFVGARNGWSAWRLQSSGAGCASVAPARPAVHRQSLPTIAEVLQQVRAVPGEKKTGNTCWSSQRCVPERQYGREYRQHTDGAMEANDNVHDSSVRSCKSLLTSTPRS
mgnify:CR=1 FL=1